MAHIKSILSMAVVAVIVTADGRHGECLVGENGEGSKSSGSTTLVLVQQKVTPVSRSCCDDDRPGGYYEQSVLELDANPKSNPACRPALRPLVEVWLAEIAGQSLTNKEVFSRLCVPGRCTEDLLEPLVHRLTDPRNACGMYAEPQWAENFQNKMKVLPILSKGYLALPPDVSVVGEGRALLFDLGASFYDGFNPGTNETISGWGSSGKWFVDEYQKRGITLDHLYLWEANNNEEDYRQAGLPKYYEDRISFFHGEVRTTGEGTQNPFNVLKAECKPDDYCIFKLDFDEPVEEEKIFRAISENDGGVRDLVDELFWDTADYTSLRMYDGLLALRQKGVRAHAWV